MGIKFANNSESTLASGISAGATTLTVAAGHGTRFPTVVSGAGDFFYVTLVNISGEREVIKVTEHQAGTDVFQVMERAADAISNGTPTAYVFATGDVVQIRVPAVAILTPTETRSQTFQLDSQDTGPLLNNNSGTLEIRNAADSAYANLHALGLTLEQALVIGGSITGVTSLVMSGALSGVTTLAMAGALSGVTTLAMGGTLTGATDITASGELNAQNVYASSESIFSDDVSVLGELTVTGNSSIPIDNRGDGKQINARDHGTGSTDEVVNVAYGTGSPPAANTTTIGTLFIKYIA